MIMVIKMITMMIKLIKITIKNYENDHYDNKNYHNDNKIKMLIPDVGEVRRSQQTLFGNPEYNV